MAKTLKDKTAAADRLYGQVGADYLEHSLEGVLDDATEDFGTMLVEEWTVHPAEYHLPAADQIVEWVVEWAEENGEVSEEWDCPGAADDAGVLFFAETLRNAIAAKVTWRMADKRVAVWEVTWWLGFDDTIEHSLEKVWERACE